MFLGWFLVRFPEKMLLREVQQLYCQLLSHPTSNMVDNKLRYLVLHNIHTFLLEEEHRMMVAEAGC